MGQLENNIDILIKSVNNLTTTVTELKSRIDDVNSKISNVEAKLDAKIQCIDSRVKSLESDFEFYSNYFEEAKVDHEKFSNQIRDLACTNKNLKKETDNLAVSLQNEKIARNRDAQYHRSSVNVKITGLPMQTGEDQYTTTNNKATLAVINNLVRAAGIDNYNSNQIDVCHRIGTSHFSPIILRFWKKDDRCTFFKQKGKLKDITPEKCNLKINKDELGNWRRFMAGNIKNVDKASPNIFMQEHLTSINGELLKSSKAKAKGLGYDYPGYVIDGEVRCRKAQGEKYIAIKCEKDLEKIK